MSSWTVRAHDLRAEQAKILANILLESDPDQPPPTNDGRRHIASPAGSEQRLRGIPVVGARGVGGTIKGTNPLAALISKERREPEPYRPEPTSKSVSYRRALVSMLIQRDGAACYLCRNVPALTQLDVEHIIPVSHGGDRTDASNMALACATCNITSGAPRYHHPQQFR